MDDSMIYWLWLRTHTPAASPIGRQLLHVFGSAEGVYCASKEQLERMETLSVSELARLSEKDTYFEERTLAYCKRYRVGLLTWSDAEYPETLRMLANPPILLCYFGKLPRFDSCRTFSVVGTRRMSEYGKKMTYEIAYGLAKAGVTVVSGMALGIDSVAAAACIAAGGTTVAVLGNGFGRIYPQEHAKLQSEIIRHGAVITEYVPGEEPVPEHFPQRNRIIAALGGGLAVMEAGKGSGALISARIAAELGKPIFVLPENATEPNGYGTAFLAKQGASVFTSAYDVLDHFGLEAQAALVPKRIKSNADEMLAKLGVSSRPYNSPTHSSAAVAKEEAPSEKRVAKEKHRAAVTDAETEKGNDCDSFASQEDVSLALGERVARLYRRIPAEESILSDFLIADSEDPKQAANDLTVLEISGYIECLPGGYFRRSKSK